MKLRVNAVAGMLVILGLPSSGPAITIGFDNLTRGSSSPDPYLGSTEKGFDIAPTKANWYKGISLDGSEKEVWFGSPYATVYDARIEVKRSDGGLLTFKSLQAYAEGSGYACRIRGMLLGREVFFAGGGVGLQDGWKTVTNPRPTIQVDKVWVYFQSDLSGTVSLDNIVVDAVPEPAAFAALAIGLALLTRRRRTARTEKEIDDD